MNKKKYFLISLLALATVVFANSATLFAKANKQKKVELRKTPNPASDFEYELSKAGDGVMITKYIGKDKEVLIPAKIEDFAVTELERKLFAKSGVTSVVIPDSVIEIGGWVFNGCKHLQKVVLPKNLTKIPDAAFQGCTNLTSIQLPSSVETIGNYAFNRTSLTSISLPPNLKKIGEMAFAGSSFESFVIPDSVTEMRYGVFSGNQNLRSLTLSKNMKVMPYLGAEDGGCPPNLSELKNFEQLTTFSKAMIFDNYSNLFLGCSKLPLGIQKKLRDLGYTGGFKEKKY